MTRLKLFFSSVWDFLRPFVEMFLSQIGPALAESALTAVRITASSMTDADGDAKRRAAFAQIVEDLKCRGIAVGADVTTSMINAAIEAAVQRVKASG